jgi:deoxyribodipyrimidine photo-lyase
MRLIVGSYLVNELGLNWRLGADYFASHLVDIDYVQNLYNWLWLEGGLPFSQASNRRMKVDVQEGKYKVNCV